MNCRPRQPRTSTRQALSPALWLSVTALLSACGGGDDNEALMRPGENCMGGGCHSNFTVAGTVFPAADSAATAGLANVTVVVVGADDNKVTMTTNAAGNFYTSAALALPLKSTYVIRNGVRTDMGGSPDGGCASAGCHTPNDTGRVYAP